MVLCSQRSDSLLTVVNACQDCIAHQQLERGAATRRLKFMFLIIPSWLWLVQSTKEETEHYFEERLKNLRLAREQSGVPNVSD
jgi:hypothetical protein